ncbi:MAG: AAA family ATPase [Clostridiaceae bacterium]|mgnify:CR=1 FL=1|nr:AAA family ATPase [Clostridiaceae bacterium]
MMIHSIRIDAFGKLKDFSFAFKEGLNCIAKENEFGKSTILAFIRAMFYGFPKRAKRGNREYGRGKYEPWSAGGYGGTVTFSHGGRSYRIERRFSGRKAGDRVVLRDEQTGKATDTGDLEIGEFLFEFSEAEFVNTFFIGQLSTNLYSTGCPTNAVADRLANLAATGSEHFSFETADRNLKAAIVAMVAARGDGGLIRDLEREREEWTGKLLDSENRVLQIKEADTEIEEIRQEADRAERDEWTPVIQQRERQTKIIEQLRDEQSGLESERAGRTERLRALEEMIAERKEYEKKEAERKKKREERIRLLDKEAIEWNITLSRRELEARRIEDELTEAANRHAMDIPALARSCDRTTVERNQLEKEKDALLEENGKYSEDRSAREKAAFLRVWIPSALLSLLFAAAGLLGFILAEFLKDSKMIWLIWLFLPAAFFAAYSVILFLRYRRALAKFRQKKEMLGTRLSELNYTIAEVSARLKESQTELERAKEKFELIREGKMNAIRLIKGTIETIRSDLSKHDAERHALLSEIAAEEAKTNAPISPETGTDSVVHPAVLTQPEEELISERAALSALNEKIAVLRDRFEEAVRAEKPLEERETEIRSVIRNLREEVSRRSGHLESLSASRTDPSEIEERIDQIEERIRHAREYYDSLVLAAEAMSEASSEMERIFAPQVNEIAGRYLAKLSGKKYAAMRFDRDFSVEISDRSDGIYRDADFFSAGTVDQVYLALRLAIADMIDPSEEKMPLLLDDALVQYDDARARLAVRLFDELSSRRQIIMFTCHKSVEDLFQETMGEADGTVDTSS